MVTRKFMQTIKTASGPPREKGSGASSVSSHEHLQNNNLPQRITTERFARVPVDKISCVSVRRLHLKTLSHTN